MKTTDHICSYDTMHLNPLLNSWKYQ